jgi:hypothetical protein
MTELIVVGFKKNMYRASLQPLDSAVFVLARTINPDLVADAFKGYGGTVLRTTLSKEQQAKVEATLTSTSGASHLKSSWVWTRRDAQRSFEPSRGRRFSAAREERTRCAQRERPSCQWSPPSARSRSRDDPCATGAPLRRSTQTSPHS